MNNRFRPTRLAFLILAILFSVAAAAAQDYYDPGYSEVAETEEKVPTATIKGKVIYDDSSKPVRYGTVGLKPVEGSDTTDFVKTDAEGNFEIRDVPAGTYNPVVNVSGVLNPATLESYPLLDKADPPILVFQIISIPGPGEYQIDIRAKRGGTLSGTVRYSDGEVAVDLEVKAILLAGSRKEGEPVSIGGEVETTTDGSGFYRITGMLPGDYIIQVSEPAPHKYKSSPSYAGYTNSVLSTGNLLKTFAPDALSPVDAQVVRLAPGGERNGIDITIPDKRVYTVTGRIVEKDSGKPLTDFNVEFEPVKEHPEFMLGKGSPPQIMLAGNHYYGGSERFDTEDDGRFELKNLPKGKYKLTVKQGERYYYGEEKEERENYPSVSKEVLIEDSDLTGLVIEVPKGGVVRGLIATEDGSELPEYLYFIFVADREKEESGLKSIEIVESPSGAALPAGTKMFKAEGLAEGKYKIVGSNDKYYVRSVSIGGRDVTYEPVPLSPGEELANVVVILATDGGTVAGKLEGLPSGEDWSFKGVIFVKEGGPGNFYDRIEFAPLDADSDFTTGLSPGNYRYGYWEYSDEFEDEDDAAFEKRVLSAVGSSPVITVKPRETVTVRVQYRKP